jgi:TRAP-type C4-dicarboxylate transport system permease small subunit
MFIYTTIQRLDAALAAVERALVIVLTAAIAGIMMTQVVLRYFFSAPIFWAEEISVQLLVFATLFGVSLLVRSGELVCIDFLPRALSGRSRQALLAALGVVLLVMLVFVAWLGFDWVARPDVRIELTATTQLPRWYSYAFLPAAMAAMVLHQAAAVLRHLAALKEART